MKLCRALFFAALNGLLYCTCCRQVKIFRRVVGYFPNIAAPRKFHEKMLWRKIFDHNPLFVVFCDKLATKDHIRKAAPELKVPRTLWIGHCLKNAPQDLFHADLVIKANHASSFNHFSAKGDFDLDRADAMTRNWLQTTYGQRLFEWGYFGARKLLFVEELIEARTRGELVDILVRCADGKAICVYVAAHLKTERQSLGTFYANGAPLCFEHDIETSEYGALPADFRLPGTFSTAVSLAEKLSQGVDYARFDFMTDGVNLYAGEITAYPSAGVTKASPAGALGNDTLVNRHWDLKKSWFLSTPQSGWKKLYAQALKAVL